MQSFKVNLAQRWSIRKEVVLENMEYGDFSDFLPLINQPEFLGAVITKERYLSRNIFDEALKYFRNFDKDLVARKQLESIVFSSGATILFPNVERIMGMQLSAAMIVPTPNLKTRDIQEVIIRVRRPCISKNKIWLYRGWVDNGE